MSKSDKLSKEQLAEEIMDVLGLSLDSLSRMTKADLTQLHKKVSELKAGGGLLDKPLSELLDEKIEGKPLRDMTLGELMEKTRGGGPLGFGILPELRKIIRDEIRPEIRRIIRGEKRRHE